MHRRHPGEAQAEDVQCQDHGHYKAIWTCTFRCVCTILHAQLRRPLLLHTSHRRLHMLDICSYPSRYEVKIVHFSLPLISGPSWLLGIQSEMIWVGWSPRSIRQPDHSTGARCSWKDIWAMSSLHSPEEWCCLMHDPWHHRESTIYDAWLGWAACLLGGKINTAVYNWQQTPNTGLTKRDDGDGYQAPYPTPSKMLHAFGNASHDNDDKEILYQAPLHHLLRFGCDASPPIT